MFSLVNCRGHVTPMSATFTFIGDISATLILARWPMPISRDISSETSACAPSTNQLNDGVLFGMYSCSGSVAPQQNEASNAVASGGSHVGQAGPTDREQWLAQARVHARTAAERWWSNAQKTRVPGQRAPFFAATQPTARANTISGSYHGTTPSSCDSLSSFSSSTFSSSSSS